MSQGIKRNDIISLMLLAGNSSAQKVRHHKSYVFSHPCSVCVYRSSPWMIGMITIDRLYVKFTFSTMVNLQGFWNFKLAFLVLFHAVFFPMPYLYWSILRKRSLFGLNGFIMRVWLCGEWLSCIYIHVFKIKLCICVANFHLFVNIASTFYFPTPGNIIVDSALLCKDVQTKL